MEAGPGYNTKRDTVYAVEVLWLNGPPFSIIKAYNHLTSTATKTSIWLEASYTLCVEFRTSTEFKQIERTSKLQYGIGLLAIEI